MKWLKFKDYVINPAAISNVRDEQWINGGFQKYAIRISFMGGGELYLHDTKMAEFEAALKEARR